MDARLVTVAREISSLNANIIRSRLEAEGIQCFVSGEAASSVVGLPAYVGAFIDVQVLDFDAARAHSILQEIEEAPRDGEDEMYIAEKSNSALQLWRIAVVIWLPFCVAVFVNVVTETWWLGVLAGASAFYFLAVKKSFKHKR